MRLTSFLCSRSWTSRRVRTLCSTAGVALGVGLVVAVLTVDQNAVLHKRFRAMRNWGRPHLELRREWRDAEDLNDARDELSAREGVTEVARLARRKVRFRTADGRSGLATWILTDQESTAPFAMFSWFAGAPLEPAQGTEESARIWVTAYLARERGLSIGQSLDLDGIEHLIVGLIAGNKLGAIDGGEVILSDWQDRVLAAEGIEKQADVSLWLRLARPEQRDEWLTDLAQSGFLAQPPHYDRITASAEDLAMRNGLKICALLSLFLGLFIVFHTLLMTVNERRVEISLLHALGATRRQIGSAFLAESLLQALVGSLAGVLLGVVLSFVMGKIGISSMGAARFPLAGVPWGAAFAVAGCGVVLTLLGALYPVFMTARVPTAQVLYPTGIEQENLRPSPLRWILPLVFAVGLWIVHTIMRWVVDPEAERLVSTALRLAAVLAGAVSLVLVTPAIIHGVTWVVGRVVPALGGRRYYLAWRNVSASGHRNATAVCALMLVFAAIFCMHTLTESLKDEIRVWAQGALQGRVYFQSRAPERPVDKRPFLAVEGVAAVLAVENEVAVPRLIRGIDFRDLLDANTALGPLPEHHRQALEQLGRGEGLVVTRAFASRTGVKEGGTITLPTREGPRAYPVLLVSDDYGYLRPERDYALLAPHELERAFGQRAGFANQFILHLDPEVDPFAVRDRLQPLANNRQGYLTAGAGLIDNRVRNIDKDFAVFDVVLLGAIVLAGIAMVNSLMIRALERRREIALYRALGMTREQLITGLSAEGLLLGLTGGVLALLLGYPCSVIGFEALRDVSGLNLTYAYPTFWALTCLALSVFVSYVASRYPARYLARDDVAGSLQYS